MAYCNDIPARRAQTQSLTEVVHGVVSRFLAAAAKRRAEARRAWLRHTTEVEISRLPPEIRKDIGWPTRQDY